MRDELRRMAGKMPASATGGAVGEPALHQPWPDNPTCNSAIDWGCSEVNRRCGFASQHLTLPVAAMSAGAVGPQAVDFARKLDGLDYRAQVNVLRRASWKDDADTNYTPLSLVEYRALDRSRIEWLNTPLAKPAQCWMDGYTLYLLPGNQNAGTLALVVGIGVAHPASDTEGLGPLPLDYYPCVLAWGVVYLAIQAPHDEVMQERARFWLPKAEAGIGEVKEWARHNSRSQQGGMVPQTGRVWWGRR